MGLEEELQLDQTLANCLQSGKLVKALKISLRTDKPRTALRVLKEMAEEDKDLTKIPGCLNDLQKKRILEFAASWNCHSGSYQIAQKIMKNLLDSQDMETDMKGVPLQQWMAYNDRHMNRVNGLASKTAIVDMLLHGM